MDTLNTFTFENACQLKNDHELIWRSPSITINNVKYEWMRLLVVPTHFTEHDIIPKVYAIMEGITEFPVDGYSNYTVALLYRDDIKPQPNFNVYDFFKAMEENKLSINPAKYL